MFPYKSLPFPENVDKGAAHGGVGQLVGWSVFSRLSFRHELYTKTQSIFSHYFFAFSFSFAKFVR